MICEKSRMTDLGKFTRKKGIFSVKEKIARAIVLVQNGASVREKFLLGRWHYCFYIHKPKSPTGVQIAMQLDQTEETRAIFGRYAKPANVLNG